MGVRLADVADALTMGGDFVSYYDRQDGQLVWVFNDELSAAEDLPENADLAEAVKYTNSGDVESLKLALLIVEDTTRRFVPLPTSHDVHEHSIMVDFTDTLPESGLRNQLSDALRHAGAFRRFKDLVHSHDIADAWYRFRDEELTRIARKWADANNITFAE